MYLGVMIMALIFAIALAVSNMFVVRMQLARDITSSTAALYASDSALECAQYVIDQQSIAQPAVTSCSVLSAPGGAILNHCGSLSFSNGSTASISQGDIICNNLNDTIKSIKSIGNFSGVSRSAEVDY